MAESGSGRASARASARAPRPRSRPVVLPPATNRGVTVAWGGLHWLAGTTRLPVADVLDSLTATFGGCAFEPLERGGFGYHMAAVGPAGARAYWTHGRADVHVVLPGQACEHLGLAGVVGAAVALDLVPTRVDFAWDCEGITPAELRGWFQDGQVVTRAHRESWGWQESATGTTFTLGARSSERYLRCYDQRGPTRVELEVKGDRAPVVWAHLLEHQEADWSRAAMALLRDFVDFRDRSSGVRPDCAPLLPKWAVVVDGAGRQALKIPRPVFSLERSRSWLSRSVFPVLALVSACESNPERFVTDALTAGRSRWRGRHRALLATVGGGTLNLGVPA